MTLWVNASASRKPDEAMGAPRALTIAFGTHAATVPRRAFHLPSLLIFSAPVWALFGRRRS